jgi:hypothetical protein
MGSDLLYAQGAPRRLAFRCSLDLKQDSTACFFRRGIVSEGSCSTTNASTSSLEAGLLDGLALRPHRADEG